MNRDRGCCCHVSPALIARAVEQVCRHRNSALKHSSYDLVCVHCGQKGACMSLEFHRHLLDHRHYLSVRTEFPHELYCDYCGDYQYSTEFDEMVGRKRHRTIPRHPEPSKAGWGEAMSSSSPIKRKLATTTMSSPTKSQHSEVGSSAGSAKTKGGPLLAVEDARNIERYNTMSERPPSSYQPRGITNMGATCFMSSVLQVMLHNLDVRTALQRSLPFDVGGAILLPQFRCRKREIDGKLKEGARGGGEEDSAIGLKASQGVSNSLQPLLAMTSGNSGDGASQGHTTSTRPPPGTSWKEESKLRTGRDGVDANGGGDVEQSRTNTSTTPQRSQGSSPGCGAVVEKDTEGAHDLMPNATVTYGCIPCELRALFVESMEVSQAVGAGVYNEAPRGALPGQTAAVTTIASASSSVLTDSATMTAKKLKRLFPPLVPFKLLYSVWAFADHMAGYEQQDAHEFFIAFLDGVETHLKLYHTPAQPSSTSSEAKKSVRDKEVICDSTPPYRALTSIFSGKLESEVQCEKCNCISSTVDPFLDISLSLDQPSDKTPFQGIDLQSCLTAFTAPESLSTPIFCERCKENRTSVKKLTIKEPPKILAVHLKRFDAVSQRKVHAKVTFPVEELDIGPFMQSQCKKKPAHARVGAERVAKYSLVGVITHKGSLNSGHYISYVVSEAVEKQAEWQGEERSVQQWLRCDDEVVTAVTVDEVRNTEGYILFYAAK